MDGFENRIYRGDCREVLQKIPDDSIDLVVTSPPYNVGVDYGSYDDEVPLSDYFTLIESAFQILDEKVKGSGRVCVNVSLKNDNGIVDIPSVVKQKADEVGWTTRFEIIWDKGTSEASSAWGSWRSPSSPRPIFNHEYIFVFDVQSGVREKKEKSIEKEEFMKLVKSVWRVPPEKHIDHPAPFPEEIPERLIKLNSYENDVVLDPFAGSGTTPKVAEKLGRKWIGIDVDSDYVESMRERLNSFNEIQEDESLFDY